MRFELDHPAIATIPSTPKNIVGRRGAQDGWNCMNASLFIVGQVFHCSITNSSTYCYSVVELAMEPYTRTGRRKRRS